jgi:two-component sensor histidine kinase
LLTVADSGAGLPQDFDFEKAKGLGVRIVTALARTLDAKLKVKARNPGSEFALQIPLRSVTSTQFH